MSQGTTPRSRRERPAKAPLTREGIIDVALGILRSEGLRKVTLRRIAAELDTGPASLYVYIRNAEDLHGQLIDAFLEPVVASAEASVDRPSVDWRSRIKALLDEYRRALYRQPELARIALTTQLSGPNYLMVVDAVLGALAAGGVPDRESAWAVDMLLLHATAEVVEHAEHQDDEGVGGGAAQSLSVLTSQIEAVDGAKYPHIARLGPDLLSGNGTQRNHWAVEALLNGVLATPRPE
ncbi:TetR/AcrR family transcriptional regulator [Nakamurella silvestris]|nr:TetR/AcrR family transcriptional regulator [Nakamurella silvestris]